MGQKPGYFAEKSPKKLSNKKGQGRKISYPQELKDKIVSRSVLLFRLKALSVIKDHPNFKAWVRKFMHEKNDLVLHST